MRSQASVLHLDLDAFFAAVEQRDKPSLRGKPVVVGGVGGRGVVATASYEARRFGVHSAMPTAQARRLCPHAAFLRGRFGAYQEASRQVMEALRELSPVVEPLSLDEAYVDLTAVDRTGQDADPGPYDVARLHDIGRALKARVHEVTGGLTGSVGIASSKLLAKIASDLDKPDGLVVIAPGTEQDVLRPMQVGVIPGVGPATQERLRRVGVHTVEELQALSVDELVRLLGNAHGRGLHALARAEDERPVVGVRETKSISVEDTYDTDHTDRRLIEGLVQRQADKVAERLRSARLSGRTVTLKVRLHDFSTHTRATTLRSPTDDGRVVGRSARALVDDIDLSGGVRLLGVGVSGLTDWIQEDLFGEEDEPPVEPAPEPAEETVSYSPGMDVVHVEHGRGWVWGAGKGVVTVRFETATSGPGRVLSFRLDDPDLTSATPPRD